MPPGLVTCQVLSNLYFEPMKLNRVSSVRYLDRYRLRICFADGAEFTLDFAAMLEGHNDPLHAPLKNPDIFRQVQTNGLTLEWPTGLDICPDGLRQWCEAGKVLPESAQQTLVSTH